jgi:DNA-directed RNA polymerase specialized sigma24 family protein
MTLFNKAMTHPGLLRELWNFSLRVTRNMQLAEKLVATTYTIAARIDISLTKDKPPRIVMFSVALNSWLKHRDSYRLFIDDFPLTERTTEVDLCFSTRTLNSLAEHERIAVILVDGHKLGFEDAAWVLGTKTDTLKKWLLRAYTARLP